MTGPALVRGLARALVRLFYRRVEVVGAERVPRAGPLIVVANHRNAIVDALLVLATLPRTLRPVAKAPLFRHPILAPFLRLAGAVPVHRRRDPGSDPTQNAAMFAAVATALRDGDAILIFPEGVSQPEPVLMPLRTGVARVALGTEAGAGSPAATLLPVGLTFHEPGTFRNGWALVLVGEPVRVDDCRALALTEPERAVRELTDRVADALRALIVEAEDRETLRLALGLEAIHRAEAEEAPGLAATPSAADVPAPAGRGGSRAERVAWVQAATRADRWLTTRAPAEVTRLRGEVERYLADLERLGLSPRVVGRAYPPGVARRYAMREGLALLGGIPLAAWGVASHALPYWLTALAARALATSADVTATVKLVAGAVLYPVCWALEGWVVWRWLGGWGLALFVAGLIPAGLIALSWQARLARVRRDAGAFLRFLGDRDLLARLAARRRALVDDVEALARLVPPEVLAGGASPGGSPRAPASPGGGLPGSGPPSPAR
jgi:glycerol-3-phosphate O-acyltransferase / dihydroxyacetone phosphate acyltransferase